MQLNEVRDWKIRNEHVISLFLHYKRQRGKEIAPRRLQASFRLCRLNDDDDDKDSQSGVRKEKREKKRKRVSLRECVKKLSK